MSKYKLCRGFKELMPVDYKKHEFLKNTIEEVSNVYGYKMIKPCCIEESDLLVALRVEADEEMSKEIEELESVLTNANSSVEEKNEAYEKIKNLNSKRSEEEKLESQIKENHKLDAFVKINGNNISVIVKSDNHSNNIANNIMRTIQSNYEDGKYITVKFQK